jgi:hypothetical protein
MRRRIARSWDILEREMVGVIRQLDLDGEKNSLEQQVDTAASLTKKGSKRNTVTMKPPRTNVELGYRSGEIGGFMHAFLGGIEKIGANCQIDFCGECGRTKLILWGTQLGLPVALGRFERTLVRKSEDFRRFQEE